MRALATGTRWARVFAITLAGAAISCSDDGGLGAARGLCLAPEGIDFGPQTVRTAITRSVQITSCGGIPLDVFNVNVAPINDGDPPPPFLIEETEIQLPLEVGERFPLPIRFRPPGLADYEGKLQFWFGEEAVGDPAAEALLTGSGIDRPACETISLTDMLDYGPTQVGNSRDLEVTLQNVGDLDCELSATRIVAGHDHFSIPTPPAATLAPMDTTTFTVRFRPTAAGMITGRAAAVAAEEPQAAGVVISSQIEVPLTGDAGSVDACVLVAEPEPLILPRATTNLPASATSATTRVRSIGQRDCTISDVRITTGVNHFAVGSAPMVGTVMMTGAEEPVRIDFAPIVAGARSGTLTVNTMEGTTLDVDLDGFADPTPVCALRFNPSPVAFDRVAVGLSAELDLVATNNSIVDCDVQSIALSGQSGADFQIAANPGPGVILPGNDVTVRVRFTPQSASLALGEVEFDLGGGEIIAAELFGFGDYAEVKLTPVEHFFGIVTEGCNSRVADIALDNVGLVAARVEQVGFSVGSDPNFELLTPVTPGTILPPGGNIMLQTRMLGEPIPWGHYGALVARTTGTVNPVARSQQYGQSDTVANSAIVDVFVQGQRPIVDILFVIDDSGSMGQEQANLAMNFTAFIDFFTTQVDADYHIGVTTTDTFSSNAGHLRQPMGTLDPWVDNTAADPVMAFTSAANVGTVGSANERGFKAAEMALDPTGLGAPGGPNAGFLRDEALLSVIYVSDENDQSQNPGAVNDYVDMLLALKGYVADKVIASAIAGDVPGGCSGATGNASAGDRYLAISVALNGVFASICAPDWSMTMEQIGLGTFNALTRFELSRDPDPMSIVVTVNGVVVMEDPLNGWSYDPVNNNIVFNGISVPQAGDDIEVGYTAECL